MILSKEDGLVEIYSIDDADRAVFYKGYVSIISIILFNVLKNVYGNKKLAQISSLKT